MRNSGLFHKTVYDAWLPTNIPVQVVVDLKEKLRAYYMEEN